jgi:primary-amine oxidase
MQTLEPAVVTTKHPLDPLSANEIQAASDILKKERALDSGHRFVYVMLNEPAKKEFLAWKPGTGTQLDRQAFAVIRDRFRRKTYEAVVSLTKQKVVGWEEIANVQAPIMLEEFMAVDEIVKQDPRWQAALRRRGITDFEMAITDAWSNGYYSDDDAASSGRFCRPLTWIRPGPGEHVYARPIEGLIVKFDLDRMEVVEVEDHGVVPVPPRTANYGADQISDPNNVPFFPDGVRKDVKALDITQPEGAGFQVAGNQVSWQKWKFRIGFNPREGMVLHTVSYNDGGEERPIIFRASLVEMFIPYGDPAPTQYRKNVFDMGEYGVGMMTNSLELGCDCLGEIRYFDGVINDNDGGALPIRNAICLHEEDFGILWKHQDFRTGETEVRRSRRLVVSTIATIGNYEYGYFWYFYQDGGIGYEVKMTGVMSNGAVPEGVKPKHGALVAPGVYGPHHQHFFSVRLDMMVDGLKNTVYECDSEGLPPGPDNPHGNAWIVKQTPFERESEAQSIINPLAARYWKIANGGKLNAVGEPVAYKLMPGDNVLPFFQPDAYALQRARFITKHLWVTKYDPDEMFAAGDYPNQHAGGAGLPEFVKSDSALEDEDVVLWYTMGAHHPVRPEEWPVMPVKYIGFHLLPHGFFDGNPALDVPSSHSVHHAHHADHAGHDHANHNGH